MQIQMHVCIEYETKNESAFITLIKIPQAPLHVQPTYFTEFVKEKINKKIHHMKCCLMICPLNKLRYYVMEWRFVQGLPCVMNDSFPKKHRILERNNIYFWKRIPGRKMKRRFFIVGSGEDLGAVFDQNIGSEWEAFDTRVMKGRASVYVFVIQ